jgi:hypothetical protein
MCVNLSTFMRKRKKELMKTFLKACLVLLLLVPISPALSQPQPYSSGLARALGNLINTFCLADPTFEFEPPDSLAFPQGNASVQAVSDTDTGANSTDGDDIRTLAVTVTHGGPSSNHTIIYEDNDASGSLTCADTILAVA